MKKLTDEAVAKKLGWKRGEIYATILGQSMYEWISPEGRGNGNVPSFTTSLDAIVGEIEARGLDWAGYTFVDGFCAEVSGDKMRSEEMDTTTPLALCRALIAYLESK